MAGLDDSSYLHGECDTPGGNSVAVDAITRRSILCAVQISGDFCVEPETAREAVRAALLALPMNASQALIAEAVHDALGERARLIGVSPEDIATAAWRALQTAA